MKIGDLVTVCDSSWSSEIGVVVEVKPWHEEGHRICVLMSGAQKQWLYYEQLKVVNAS
tara:strand:+ start:3829 stop:4002 length:174 start_codon:yes stop_codon:yes gene_type:complete